MPDFRQLVRAKLPLPPMKRRREEAIIEELALQLQDFYREGRSRGMEERDAVAHALAHIPDWEAFASEIAMAERANLHPGSHESIENLEISVRGRGGVWILLADLGQDLRYALRAMRCRPALLLAMILTLALGIGANTAIYSVLHGVLLLPFPFPEPDRLVTVWTPRTEYGFNPLSAPDYTDYRERSDVFDCWGAFTSRMVNVTGSGSPVRLRAVSCTAEILPALGASPALGRAFSASEADDPAARVVLLGDRLWKSRYGADPGLVGRDIVIDKENRTVIGIMPEGFRFPVWRNLNEPDLLLPLRVDPQQSDRGSYFLFTIGRLREGVSIESAESEMKTIAARLQNEYPESNTQRTARVVPLRDVVLGDAANRLWPLMGATGVILLIACLNVAGLLMAREGRRAAEAALRAALGAGRGRLIRQMLTESCLVALMGGVVGLLLAGWGTALLRGSISLDLPRTADLRIDASVLLFTLAATFLTGILFGVLPALAASTVDIAPTLHSGVRNLSLARRPSRALSLLIVAQFSLTFVLAHGAFLMLRSLWNVTEQRELRYPERLLIAGYTPEAPDREGIIEDDPFLENLVDRLGTIPGVEAAGAAARLPLWGQGWSGGVLVDGQVYDPEADRPLTYFNCVTPGWFEAMGITLLQGRGIEPRDRREGNLGIVVNRAFVDISWPGENAIGKRVTSDDENPWFEAVIVGVVENVRQNGLESDIHREIYFPFFPSFVRDRWLALRARGDPLTLTPHLRRELSALDPDLPLSRVMTGAELYDSAAAGRRFNTGLIGLFAIIASCLIAAGISGVMSYHVSRRTHEMGIRIALGADRLRVFRMVVKRSLVLVFAGIALGVAGASVTAGLLGSLLYGVGPLDLLSLCAVCVLLLLVALAATLSPALRAVRTNPVEAIRAE